MVGVQGSHQHLARRLSRAVGFALAALASCYVGLLFSRLLWDAPRLLVAAFTDAEIVGRGRFGPLSALPVLYVLQPSEASALMFALYAAGAIAVAVVLLAACRGFAGSFSGWSRLTLVFLGFWTAQLLGGAAVRFALGGMGPVSALASMVEGASSTVGRRVVATAVVMVCWLCLMRLLQSLVDKPGSSAGQRATRLALWFVLPVVVLIATLSGWQLGRLQQFGDLFTLLVVTAVPLLGAIRFPGVRIKPFRPTMIGAAVTVVAGAVALASVITYSAAERQPEQPEFESLQSNHWEISFEQGAFSAQERQEWARAADLRIEQYSRRLGLPLDGARLRSRVFLSTKNKRAITRETRDDQPFTLSQEPLTLDQLLAPDQAPADPRGEPLLLMAQAWGSAASKPVAEAVARYAVGGFFNHSLDGYARLIACEEQPYALTDVLEISSRYLSPLVRDALAGAWVESLVEQHGIEVLPRVYRAIPAEEGPGTIAGALGSSWNELEAAWRSDLATAGASCDPPTRAVRNAAPQVHHGISFSHEVGGDWGYGSDSAQRELEKIRQLGANSVAVMPYAFTRAPEETSIRFRTDETDARVIRTIEQAKHAGLRVMLKPHLWGRGFTGDIQFASDDDFQIWWESYRSWLLHFARLAEIYNVELLALGNELAGLTVREPAWRELIRDVRRIYRGELTYASHWDGEFERVSFWDQLDYIGLNAYFPLAGPGEIPGADSSHLAKIRSRLAAVAGRFNKPLLFTEVGYSSIDTAALEPWAEGSGALDLRAQQQCYEVIFESFARQPWFAGTYWWKWPSHGRGGPYDLSHRPNGKPAMEVLRRWFREDSTVSTISER